ncbi:protease secretion system outer membrane protein [Pantoea alhagi]|uniref:TolC family outer membrane protein n=1 Tax=Mixta sp. BE291 TaxID=3158787 RepID=UPI002857B8ED|nr:protease secretion system outer membrane protein [Pantoea alhagi]
MNTKIIGSFLFYALCSLPAHALSMVDIYALAQQKDPAIQAAMQEKLAGEEDVNIGRAGLLPTVSLSWQSGLKNWQTSETEQSKGLFSKETHRVTTRRQYQSQSGSIMLKQPLFNYQAWAGYQKGKAQSLMSEANWRASFMDLAVRVINRYLDVMAAQDKVMLVDEQQAAYRQQLRQNQLMLDSGEGTITEVIETESRLSLSAAERMVALDELSAAQHELESLIGQRIESLSQLDRLTPGNFQPIALVPAGFEQWQQLALQDNAELAVSRQQLRVNHYQTEQQRAGFFPQVELYASHTINHSSSDSTINQRHQTNSIGIQLNYALFTGGQSSATLRQSSALYNKSKFELEKDTQTALNNLHIFFNRCHNAQQRLTAYQQAVQSATLQIKAVQQGIIAGMRTNLDLLNAERQLFNARLDLENEKYNYLRARVKLLYHSGQLAPDKMAEIAGYFTRQ